MSRILFVYERGMPTVSILCDFFKGLAEAYHIESTFMPLLNVTEEDIDRHEILYFIRPDNVYSHRIAKMARKIGKFVIVSLDDDLLNLPKSNPSMPWRRKSVKRAIENADVLISSSPHILRKYQNWTVKKRCAQIDTIVREEEISKLLPDRIEDRRIKIVYAANPSHYTLFNSYILPVMKDLAERYANRLQFTFVGVRPDLDSYKPYFDVRYIKGMPLSEYRAFMQEEQFDIGLAPLHDSEFAKCKYFNKYLEYTLSGIAGVYSNVEPYTYVVKDGENGFLAQNTETDWFQAMCRAIDDHELRRTVLQNAQAHVRASFNEEKVIKQLTEDIPELLSMPTNDKKCPSLNLSKLTYYLMRPMDWFYLVIFYLTKTGLKGFMNKVKTHLRERGAYARK